MNLRGRSAGDIHLAAGSGRTAVFFGAQNPSIIEQDLGDVPAEYLSAAPESPSPVAAPEKSHPSECYDRN